jgi:hypothetical protein
MKPALNTQLGNSSAKWVLFLIADQVNSHGYGWPSVDFIVHGTEIKRRTVQRIIGVFTEMKLLTKISRGYRRTPGLQLNLEKLGANLEEEFLKLYNDAQGKISTERRSDTEENAEPSVVATQQSVVATQQSVAATLPPDPLIGRPLINPLQTHPLASPTLPFGNSAAPRSQEQELGCERGLEAVMQACGFTSKRLRPIVRSQLEQEADKGTEPASAALAMIAAWKRYAETGDQLRFKWGAVRFFAEGYWRAPTSWPWDFATR